MTKTLLSLALMAAVLASCTKKDETVNNYTTVGGQQPAFSINGITDQLLVNDESYGASLSLTVQYLDSAQENVTLALNDLPAGFTIDTTWVHSGIPTFSTTLNIFDTSAEGAEPGSYPVSIIATTASGKKKTYPFNLKVQGMPTTFLGKYNNCRTTCGGSTTYTDSVYADGTVRNKIWFSNFANMGVAVYGLVSNPDVITIPSQVIGGITYYTAGTTINLNNHSMTFTVRNTTSNCGVIMN